MNTNTDRKSVSDNEKWLLSRWEAGQRPAVEPGILAALVEIRRRNAPFAAGNQPVRRVS
jgi:hypothetical protein